MIKAVLLLHFGTSADDKTTKPLVSDYQIGKLLSIT
jgi:hypothetical protein